MQVVTLTAWPFAVRTIVGLAQTLADAKNHALTSPAHVAHVLYAMKPVRQLVEGSLTPAVVEAALMVEKKAGITKAVVSPPLAQVLMRSAAPSTASFLRDFAAGLRFGTAFATHADAIAALLDHPRLESIIKEPMSPAVRAEAPELSLACSRASSAKHAQLTTRHVVLAAVVLVDAALKRHGLEGLEPEITRLTELLDQTLEKSERMGTSPRLFGAVAQVLAEGTFATDLTMACFEDDDAVAFVAQPLYDGQERALAAGG